MEQTAGCNRRLSGPAKKTSDNRLSTWEMPPLEAQDTQQHTAHDGRPAAFNLIDDTCSSINDARRRESHRKHKIAMPLAIHVLNQLSHNGRQVHRASHDVNLPLFVTFNHIYACLFHSPSKFVIG